MSGIYSNFTHAFRGLRYAFQEDIFKIHCGIAIVVLLAGVLFRITMIEFILIFLAIGWVLTLEILNTIIEHVVDLFKPEFHPHAKIIKDLASGAVLVFSFVAFCIGMVIFFPRFVQLFYSVAEWLVR